MAKEKKQKNRKGIQFQIQSKIGAAIVAVMSIIAILVVTVVYNLVIDANDKDLEQGAEAVSLQVEKYFAPFEGIVQQFATDEDVKNILDTTKAGERMTENSIYPTVLEKMVATANLDTQNIQGTFVADLDSSASITSGGTISGKDYDVTTRVWYDCTKTGKTMITKPYISASTGKTICTGQAFLLHFVR